MTALHRSLVIFLMILTIVITVTPTGRFRLREGLDSAAEPDQALSGWGPGGF